MHDEQFKSAYARIQERVSVTDGLKRATLARIAEEAERQTDAAPAARIAAHAPTARRSRLRWKIIGAAAAACLVATAIGIGISIPGLHGAGESTAPRFTVQAYAADAQSPVALGDNGIIVFSRENAMGYGISQNYSEQGCYTGCLFSIEAQDAVRVQASISRGMLYRYSYDSFTLSEAPGKWREALGWKPTSRGLGTYYEGYDVVRPAYVDDGLGKDDPNAQCQVNLAKRLGEVADLALDGEKLYLGLWTNAPYSDTDGTEELDAIIDTFEGETLTVTVTFSDGSTSTQVIELHAADMKLASSQTAGDAAAADRILPEAYNPDEPLEDGEYAVHTLCGTVIESTNGAFPGSLDDANRLEHTVDAHETLDEIPLYSDETEPINAHEQDETIYVLGYLGDGMQEAIENQPTIKVSDVSAKVVDTLPDGVSIEQTQVMAMGSLDYFNRVRSQTSNLTLDENGIPSEGHTLVQVDYTVENTSDEQRSLSLTHFGWFGRLENGSQYRYLWGGEFDLYYAAALSDGTAHSGYGDTDITLEPGESAQVSSIYIFANELLDEPNLVFAPASGGAPDQALRLEIVRDGE